MAVFFFMGKNWEKMILCIFIYLFYTKQQSIDYKLPWNNSIKKKYPKVCPFLNIWSERQSLWIYWILHHSCKWSHFIMIRSLSSPRMILQKRRDSDTGVSFLWFNLVIQLCVTSLTWPKQRPQDLPQWDRPSTPSGKSSNRSPQLDRKLWQDLDMFLIYHPCT